MYKIHYKNKKTIKKIHFKCILAYSIRYTYLSVEKKIINSVCNEKQATSKNKSPNWMNKIFFNKFEMNNSWEFLCCSWTRNKLYFISKGLLIFFDKYHQPFLMWLCLSRRIYEINHTNWKSISYIQAYHSAYFIVSLITSKQH